MTGLFTGKALLAGGSVAALGTGGIIVYTQKPEWLGIIKEKPSNENRSSEFTTPWVDTLGLPDKCKNSINCDLNKGEIEQLGFVFGEKNKSNNHISNTTNDPAATFSWKTIEANEEDFPFKLLFTITSKADNLEILKENGQNENKITIPATGMEFKLKKEVNEQNNKYYFQQLTQIDREKNSGMNCNDSSNSCSQITSGNNINGLNADHTVTKKKDSSISSKYPHGFKYKVSTGSFFSEDGYYKLELSKGENKWKLTKVEDLFTKWDESILSSGTWKVNPEDEAISNKLNVVVDSSKKSDNTSLVFNWECEITVNGTIENGKTLSLNDQKTKLKQQLGIDPSQTIDSNPEVLKRRKIFVENCANNRTPEQKTKAEKDTMEASSKIESTIKLKTEVKGEENQKQLQFKDFENLWTTEINLNNP